MDYITQVSGNVSPYDMRIFGVEKDAVEDPTIEYFTVSGKV